MPGEGSARELRSTVDITIDPDDMVQVRDELRGKLIRQYHYLLMLARANRKVGNYERGRQQEAEADKTQLMIWTLDNPMEALTMASPEGDT